MFVHIDLPIRTILLYSLFCVNDTFPAPNCPFTSEIQKIASRDTINGRRLSRTMKSGGRSYKTPTVQPMKKLMV